MDGILLIDKPKGPTSFDVVRKVKKATRMRKVGHAGTLDPLASGLLVVCIGQGTKLVPYLMEGRKRYLARVALGAETETDDSEGEVTKRAPVPLLNREQLEQIIPRFLGKISQIPPKYSALKQNGEALHRKARRGDAVEVSAREVEINGIEILQVDDQVFEIDVLCHKGTYIRALARDMARALGTCGHLSSLRRTESSGFAVENALSLEALDKESVHEKKLLSLAEAIPSLPKVCPDRDQELSIGHGRAIEWPDAAKLKPGEHVAVVTKEQTLLAIAKFSDNFLQPIRVFAASSID